MEINNKPQEPSTHIPNSNYANFNNNIERSSNNTKTISTRDEISNVSSISNNINNGNRDFSKLLDLIIKEKQVLKTSLPENIQNEDKPSFNELKNNVQVIQHNLDNFFCLPNKKMFGKMKKDD